MDLLLTDTGDLLIKRLFDYWDHNYTANDISELLDNVEERIDNVYDCHDVAGSLAYAFIDWHGHGLIFNFDQEVNWPACMDSAVTDYIYNLMGIDSYYHLLRFIEQKLDKWVETHQGSVCSWVLTMILTLKIWLRYLETKERSRAEMWVANVLGNPHRLKQIEDGLDKAIDETLKELKE